MKKLLARISQEANFLLEDIFAFISTPKCPGCGQPLDDNRRPICDICERSIGNNLVGDGPICLICHAPKGITCECAKAVEHPIPQLYYWSTYTEAVRRLIHKYKFEGQPEIGEYLSQLALKVICDRLKTIDLDMVIPVPMVSHDKKERGFNQSELIGRTVSKAIDIPLEIDILIKTKNTRLQAKLTARERWLNIKNAFAITGDKDLTGQSILLVDDIVTTGATCLESAATLYKAGAKKVSVFALICADIELHRGEIGRDPHN